MLHFLIGGLFYTGGVLVADSSTVIANLAIAHLGIGKQIASLTENSQEAKACNQFYNFSREYVLRDHQWPFATKFLTLTQVATDPTTEWGFSYTYPTDCLFFRRILDGTRSPSTYNKYRDQDFFFAVYQKGVPYRIVDEEGGGGKLIYSDDDNAVGEYTVNITDTNKFDAQFDMALSYHLASVIAPRITAGDPFGLGKGALEMYQRYMTAAVKSSFNEQNLDPEAEAEWVRGRQ